MVTSTRRRPGTNRSQWNGGSDRSASSGPTRAYSAGTSSSPASSPQVGAITRPGEKRGSANSAAGSPARSHRPRRTPSRQDVNSPFRPSGSPSSSEDGAKVAHRTPAACAASAPAGLC